MIRTTRRSYFGVFAVLAAMALLCVLAGGSEAAAGDTTRVSVDSSGNQVTGSSGSPSISNDGRYVVFSSNASDLVPDDTNGASDVFVRDRQTGTTDRVSEDDSGTEANGNSFLPSISDDGRYVAFTSDATNLVEGDTNGFRDVFLHDRQTGTTQRVSVGVSTDGSRTQANESSVGRPSISADGRFVVFSSWASNLVPYFDRIFGDVFVHDRQTGTTTEMSVNPSGQETNGSSFAPSISSGGRYVAFFSGASDVVAGDTNDRTDVFVRDRDTDNDAILDEPGAANTTRVRVDCAYSLCASHLSKFVTSISSDGRYVTFPLPDSSLVAGDTNGVDDIFVRDRRMGTTQRVNVHGCGTQANGGSGNPRISPDGRFVAFDSTASNLVAGDTNGFRDVFMRDLQGGTTQRVSVDGSGAQANGHSGSPSIGSDGRYVAFSSGASSLDLVTADTNGVGDIFVHERRMEPDTPPSDCIAPTSTASATTNSGADYTSGTWTNEDVKVTLGARDNEGGSEIQDIRYSATGAQTVPSTTEPGNTASVPVITAEGATTISYSATDNAGNNESPAKTFTVTIDKSAPTVDSVYPADAASDVAPWNHMAATFSEPMDPDTLTPSTFTLTEQGSSTPVAATVSYDSTYNVAWLEPSSSLASNTTYTATIKGGSTGVKDLAGNALVQDYSWTFSTAAPPDTTAPKVDTVSPANLTTGVARSINLTATFSEKMDPASVTKATFQLYKCSSTTSTNCTKQVTNVTVALSTDGLKATLNPYGTSSTLLAKNTKYMAVVTTGAKDVAGNALDQDPSTTGNQQKSWYFTTGRT